LDHPLIQSLKAMDTHPGDKSIKKEPVSKEQFQTHLSKETKKQLAEKETKLTPKKNEEKDQKNLSEKEKEKESVMDGLFSSSILTVQSGLSKSLKLSIPEVKVEIIQDITKGYIKPTDEIAIEKGREETLPVQKQNQKQVMELNKPPIDHTVEKTPTLSFEEETTNKINDNKINDNTINENKTTSTQTNPNSSLVATESGKEASLQLVGEEGVSNKGTAEVNATKEDLNTKVFETLTSPRLLTKDWTQVKKPIEAEKDVEIEQVLSSEAKDSKKTANQLESESVVINKNTAIGNEKRVSTIGVNEKEQLIVKNEDMDSNVKIDTAVAVQKNTSEPIVTKSNNQDTIRQKVTYEVNQLISKEIEQVQTKGQSSAKVTLSPAGMGDISISLELKDHVLSTKIIVDNIKIQELLTGGVPKLSDNLNRHAIQIGEVTIQLATSEQNDSRFEQRQHKKGQQTKRNITRGSFAESAPIKTASETNGKTGRLSILV